jgi:hypothetical protein
VAGARANYTPRRKAVHSDVESLVRRLNHYENLLLKYGAKKDELDGFDHGRTKDSFDSHSSAPKLRAQDMARIIGPSLQARPDHAQK